MLLSNNKYTRRMQILLFTLITASLTVVLHGIGTEQSWYWNHHWFDIITHLFGGFSLGLLTALLYEKKEKRVMFALGTVLTLIVGWEVFELLFVSTPTEELWYMTGTIKDVVVGLCSAYAAILLCQRDDHAIG